MKLMQVMVQHTHLSLQALLWEMLLVCEPHNQSPFVGKC